MKIKNLLTEMRHVFGYREMKIERMDYEEYWKSREPNVFREGSDRTERTIAGIVDAGSTLLDIGCGDGRLLSFLRLGKGIRGDGIDISKTAVARCRERGLNCRVADIQKNLKIEKDYDYIVITDVLEHIPKPEHVLLQVRGKFRKKLVITIPNIGMFFNRIRLLFGKFPLDWYWHPGEHLRHWTLADIKWWIRANKSFGLRIARIYPHTGVPVLKNIWPSMFAAGFVVELEAV